MKFVGVTACITGIAHTYMAQAALEQAAKKLDYIAQQMGALYGAP